MPWRALDISDAEVEAFGRHFKERAVFYLDESVGPAVAEMLLKMGFKVRTADDYDLRGHGDADHAAMCWREGMILVSHDADFLREEVVPEHRNPGVVVLNVKDGGGDAAYRAAWFLGSVVGPFGRHWQRTKLVISTGGEITVWVRNREMGAVEKTRYRWMPHQSIEQWVDD